MFAFRNKKFISRIALLVCAIVFGVWPYIHYALRVPLFGVSDFGVFYSAAKVIAGHTGVTAPGIYVPKFFHALVHSFRSTSGGQKFLYPPQAAVLLAPLALVSFQRATMLWLIFNVALLICTYYAIVRYLLKDDVTKIRYSLFLAIFLRFGVAYELFRTGQINGVVLALFVLVIITLQKKKMWSGVALAVATSIKIFPGVYILMLIAQKQWRAFITYCATMLALWFTTVPFFGWLGLVRFYERPLKSILAGTINNPAASASLYGLLIHIVNGAHLHNAHSIIMFGGKILTALLAASLLYIAYLFGHKRLSALTAYIFFTCAILLFSKFTQTQYTLYLLPLALVLIQKMNIHRWFISFISIIGIFSLLFWNICPALHIFFLNHLNVIGILLCTIAWSFWYTRP